MGTNEKRRFFFARSNTFCSPPVSESLERVIENIVDETDTEVAFVFAIVLITSSCISNYTLFFIRTSNFGAEAKRSYFFLRFEPETFLACS